MTNEVVPFSLSNSPALIERLLPIQKLSCEVFRERMAKSGQTLTALGSYWKGRKPLILNKACVLACLLPATDNSARDLAIFEKLMAMDDESFAIRWKRRPKPKEILAAISLADVSEYFTVKPSGVLPHSAPIDWTRPEYDAVTVLWHENLPELERRRIESQILPKVPYRERVEEARRPEEVNDAVHEHIWDAVNAHLATNAQSFPELVEQLGVMRFGHRPRVADTFCGSGQIPFEAARLGCDVFASDLNPIACMLTWGAFHIVGAPEECRARRLREQQALITEVQSQIDKLGVETDENGWRAKVFLYCVEARCPQSGWMVPLLPSLVISNSRKAIAQLTPDSKHKRYDIGIRIGVSDADMRDAERGTIEREGKYGEAYLMHHIDGVKYKTKITTLRGDYQKPDGTIANKLRLWDKGDFTPQPDDILQERLYCIQWMRPKAKGTSFDYDFRAVSDGDLQRERTVQQFVKERLKEWQSHGYVPDMQIEVGGPPRYQGLDLIRARGWTHWHHAFTPRDLLVAGLLRCAGMDALSFSRSIQRTGRLCRWASSVSTNTDVFSNQALNTLFTYASASASRFSEIALDAWGDRVPIAGSATVAQTPADKVSVMSDIFITDPPYGDAVKYEEILDYFIAWIRRNPPPEFAKWVWDSRRSLAIKGEDEDFRRSMVSAYKRMTECMPDNGIQVIMFTHQSGSIWPDMANIVWASGLQVTAAWYVATETDSALREGSYVKGTVLLVCRKRQSNHKTTRDDLAWEIQEEVDVQVRNLTGLNQEAKGLYRDDNVFEDADIQMAGYAAALRVLTRYAIIDGRDMPSEAIRPRVKGETTFVDGLIAFAVDTANQCLVPKGIAKSHWDSLSGAERFYLKLVDLEAKGFKSLDNYQNFAKAFKVRDFRCLMASQKANDSRLRNAVEFAKAEMSEGSELHQSVLRAVLYAIMELTKNIDGTEVLTHLTLNVSDYYSNQANRDLVVELADYLSKKLELLRPVEASNARVLRDLVQNQRLG